jgi:hypothetical protein
MTIETKFVELDNKLLELSNAVLELKTIVKSEQPRPKLSMEYLESLDYHSDSEELNTIKDFIRNNFDVSCVYSEDEIIEAAKNDCYLEVGDLFCEEDILQYVYDNFYPEDLIETSWR